MLKDFRTYQLAKKLYQQTKTIRIPSYLKDQLLRASSSICLNLAEGSAKLSQKDRKRFYNIAFASCREVQALIEMEDLENLKDEADRLGAYLYNLLKAL